LYPYPFTPHYFAEPRFEAAHSYAAQMMRERVEATRTEYESRFKEFLAGRGTLDFLIGSSLRLLEAGLALARNNTSRLAAFERHWRFAFESETINRGRFEAGRVPVQDYAESKYVRLEAEIWLAQAREQAKERALAVQPFPMVADVPEFSPLDSGRLAEGRWEAQHASPTQLLRERLAVAQTIFEARAKEFLAGRGTLDYVLRGGRRVREAKWALSNRHSDRIAALELYCEQTEVAERINRRRFESGRIPTQDYAQSQFYRLDAEIGLLQAKRNKDSK
jgi:hypothetical protein